MLELDDIKKMVDKDWEANQVTRERAANDMVFYYVTQWDSELLEDSQLSYKGEFNILKKAGRQIISDLAANPIEVDFEPVDENREDAADLIDGLYRTDDSNNTSLNAYEVAKQESVVCGFGAWELYTKYQTSRSGDKKQVIRRRPLFESNNTVLFDAGAKLLDKSDATRCCILVPYTEDGYKKLVEELTGREDEEVNADSFKEPERSFVFPWYTESKKIYVGKFYHRKRVKVKVLTMEDPFGQELELMESDLTDVMDDMLDDGFSIKDEKEIERWEITEYIVSGLEILSSTAIAGEHIPVVPCYGEYAYVEGELHYEGVTRLAKDPQMLRNFMGSYLADLTSQSPREKPIFFQEQIAGFEQFYSLSGAENNYAYLLQNRKAADGTDLPIGPVATMPVPNIPPAVQYLDQFSRAAVEDVANPGLPQDIADPDISGKAVIALQNRLDMQSMIYQEHFKHAKRRDGQIYASMAAEIYDVPRKVKLTMPDGSKKDATVMDTIVDKETGDLVTLNDLHNQEFEVFSRIGQSYSTRREQTVERMTNLLATIPPEDPEAKALRLKILNLMDGVDFDDIRKWSNNQLVLMGFREPDTDEEKQLLAEAQQSQKPAADMVFAMAEDKKAQAQLLEQQRKGIEMQLDAANEKLKRFIEAFDAQTSRMEAQADVAKAGAEVENKRIDAFGKKIDNTAKIIQLKNPKEMSTEELLGEIGIAQPQFDFNKAMQSLIGGIHRGAA